MTALYRDIYGFYLPISSNHSFYVLEKINFFNKNILNVSMGCYILSTKSLKGIVISSKCLACIFVSLSNFYMAKQVTPVCAFLKHVVSPLTRDVPKQKFNLLHLRIWSYLCITGVFHCMFKITAMLFLIILKKNYFVIANLT